MVQKIERQLVIRGLVGGTFMGLANLVPGISGGTMLLASGVYTKFIEAIAEVTSFRFDQKSLTVLAAVGMAAVLAILLFAGTVRNLVIDSRWAMYSLFIGLTLGGIPIIKKLLGKIDGQLWLFIFIGLFLMLGVSLLQSGEANSAGETIGWAMMFAAGAAGASAMILPGISGGYLLLVMGAYLPILHGIDQLKTSLKTSDFVLMFSVIQTVVLPVALGIVFGVAVVSNALKWTLRRFERQTYAVLFGLLVGAVFGLWPFQQTVALDTVGEIKAQKVQVVGTELIYVETKEPVKVKDIPVEAYFPGAGEVAGSLLLIAFGFGVTLLVAKLGGSDDSDLRLEA